MEIIATIFGLILVNVLFWVFAWGRRTGGVNQRLKHLENAEANSQILPECNEIFTEIKERLSGLGGKVDVLLMTMKENQKNNEKGRITKRE
ncbi:hypothetical protein KKF82_08280 [Patescibacteria group bacterium]|nr:hypothetical protein [Patescibacteria group bacterium]